MIDFTNFANAVAENAFPYNTAFQAGVRKAILEVLSRLTFPERPTKSNNYPDNFEGYVTSGKDWMYDQFKEAFEGKESYPVVEAFCESKKKEDKMEYHELTELILERIQSHEGIIFFKQEWETVDKLIREWLEEKANKYEGEYRGTLDLRYSRLREILGLEPSVNKTPESIHKESICKESEQKMTWCRHIQRKFEPITDVYEFKNRTAAIHLDDKFCPICGAPRPTEHPKAGCQIMEGLVDPLILTKTKERLKHGVPVDTTKIIESGWDSTKTMTERISAKTIEELAEKFEKYFEKYIDGDFGNKTLAKTLAKILVETFVTR